MKRMMDGTKMLWHMDRIIDHYDKGERVAPVHIDMGIAKFCNINCVFCYGIYQNPSKEFIQREALIQTMKDAGEIGVRSIGFIGDGEPTMNPHMYEALDIGKKAGLSLSLSTNGVLVNTDTKRENILRNTEWMRFCLAAGDREGYKKIHQVDKFNVVKKNIEALVKMKEDKGYVCDIGMQAVYVPGLMDEDMIKESKLAVELGVDYFVIKQCSLPEGNKKVGQVEFDVDEYDAQRTKDVLADCESYSNNKTKIIPKWKVMAQKGIRDYKGCHSIPIISEMSGNGDWFPCGYFFGNKPQFKKYKFGNVHERSLKELVESDKYWNIIKEMKEFNVQKDCAGCCRQDQANKFLDNYLNKPKGINFI